MTAFAPRRMVLRALASTTILTRVALAVGIAGVAHAESPLPVGGNVVSGSAQVGTTGTTTTVTQSSARAVVNWQSFDVAQGHGVVFAQPNAQAATLNRVTGDTTSTIAGSITSNGSVYLVNPNGIAITSTGSVQTGGGFVASTLDISNDDFNNGRLNFTGSGASKGVSNAGAIAAGSGAYVALLGGSVSNSGTISVPLGKVGLGSGESIALDLNGDGFMQVAVPSDLATSGIDMSGSIAGARVELRAAAVKDAIRTIVNVPGSINADSATGDAGSIVLSAAGGGTSATGTLTARATGAAGNGGQVETSGDSVNFTGLKVDTGSVGGKTGTWLVDPTDLTVDAAAAATIAGNLATSNVTLQTTATTATGPGTQSSGNGDITIAAPLTWSSANTLSLLAYNNINLNAPISASAGWLTLTPGSGGVNTGVVYGNNSINVGTFNLTKGNWHQNLTNLPGFAATDFRFNPAQATFLRVTGTAGDEFGNTVVDVYGLQGIGSAANFGSTYMLGGNIDASGTAKWNGGAGFLPIGIDLTGNVLNSGAGFTGSVIGANTPISGLTIRSTTSYAGLFGYSSGTITGINLVGGSIIGGTGASATGQDAGGLNGVAGGMAYTGAVVAYLAGGTISQSSSTATVTGGIGGAGSEAVSGISATMGTGGPGGASNTGGLVGYQAGGSITRSYVTGLVTGGTGGLAGNGAAGMYIGNVSVTSAIGGAGGVGGVSNTGGLVGYQAGGTTSQSWSTGTITGGAGGTGGVGGAGADNPGGNGGRGGTGGAGGATNSGGVVGYQAAGTATQLWTGGTVTTGVGGTGGRGGNSGVASYFGSRPAGGAGGASGANLTGGLGGYAASITSSYSVAAVQGSTGGAGGAGGAGSCAQVTQGLVCSGGGSTGAAGTGFTAGILGMIAAGGSINETWASGAIGGTGTLAGLIGNLNGGNSTTIVKSYWDSFSTGRTTAYGGTGSAFATNLTSDPAQSGSSSYAFTPANYFNLTAANWVFFNGTRPFGAWEFAAGTTVLTTSHQLQLIAQGSRLSTSYTLGNGIDLSETGANKGTAATSAGMWGPSGFVPIGTDGAGNVWNGTAFASSGSNGFSGNFNGNGNALTNLTVNRTTTPYNGLFGYAKGTLSNLQLTGGSVAGGSSTGALAGILSGGGTVSNVSASVAVSAPSTSSSTGGLIGQSNGTVTGSSASGTVAGGNYVGGLLGYSSNGTTTASVAAGNVSGTGSIGGLIGGQLGGSITGSSAAGNVTGGGGGGAGGLVGYMQTAGSVTKSFATGNVTNNGTGNANTGGLIGQIYNSSTIVSQVYATGAVQGTSGSNSRTGGLIGLNGFVDLGQTGSSVSQSYATGAVAGNGGSVGGLIGTTAGAITQSYASGFVSGSHANRGGLVGTNSSTVNNTNYWDVFSTGQMFAAGSGVATALQVTSNPALFAASNYAFSAGAYGNFAAGNYVPFDGQTRPFGAWEVPLSGGTVVGAHQLQLIGLNGTTLSGGYTIPYAIDLSQTGANKGTAATSGGMWTQVGFIPLGTDGLGKVWDGSAFVSGGATGFSGSLDGKSNTIGSLTIARSGTNFVGLVSVSTGALANLKLTGANVTGNAVVGALVGNMLGGSVAGSSAGGTVNGTYFTGGLIGNQSAGAITASTSNAIVGATTAFSGGLLGQQAGGTLDGSSASGAVTGGSNTGGLIGYQYSTAGKVTNSSASGNVSGTSNIGGLVGYSEGSIATSSASGAVTGASFVGGLVGRAYTGSITGSGTATTSTVTGMGNYLGGLIGYQDSGNTLTSGTARGRVNGTAANNYVGGLVGAAYGSTDKSSAQGAVTGNNWVGGAFGLIDGGARSTATTASGNVTGALYVGGFAGTASNQFVDPMTGNIVGIDGSSASGSVTGTGNTGGFVGYLAQFGQITNSLASGTVTGTGDNTGGLIGYSEGFVNQDRASGAVNGQRWTGGLIGRAVNVNSTNSVSTAAANSSATGAVGGTSDVGGLIGQADAGITIDTTHATGPVTGTGNNVGGLIGRNVGSANSSISASYATGAVSGVNNVGGLIGLQSGGALTGSDASGNVTGTSSVGGLVGLLQGTATLTSVKAAGNVIGDLYVGGLIGTQNGGDIADAYATGNFGRNGTSTFVGGLIGYQDGGTAKRTYSIGVGNGANYGGLVGYQTGSGSITASVWNTQTSEKLNGFGYQNGSPTFSAQGETTAQMQDSANTGINYLGWDFTNVWGTPSTGIYPKLKGSVAH